MNKPEHPRVQSNPRRREQAREEEEEEEDEETPTNPCDMEETNPDTTRVSPSCFRKTSVRFGLFALVLVVAAIVISFTATSSGASHKSSSIDRAPQPNVQPPSADCKVGELKTFYSSSVGIFPPPKVMKTFDFTMDLGACQLRCSKEKYASGIYFDKERKGCQCYESMGTCLVAIDKGMYNWQGGMIFTTICPSTCPGQTYCELSQDWRCFSLHHYDEIEFQPYNGDRGVAIAAQLNDTNDCFKFCAGHSLLLFRYSNDEKVCQCFDNVECLMPLGEHVDGVTLQRYGRFYSKKEIGTCDGDWCQTNPDHWYCFTGNEWSTKDSRFQGSSLIKVSEGSKQGIEECLEHCSPYEAARYEPPSLIWKNCHCYNGIDCIMDGVGKDDGLLFAKVNLHRCRDGLIPGTCVEGEEQVFDMDFVTLYPVEPTSTYHRNSLAECRTECYNNGYAVGYYSSSWTYNRNCACYDGSRFPCLAQWGDSVKANVLPQGSLFTTDCLDMCDLDFCDYYPNRWECFTGHELDFRKGSVINITPEKSAQAMSERQCLEHCQDFLIAFYLQNLGDSCSCYSQKTDTCMGVWGDSVDPNVLASGSVFVKSDIQECEKDLCGMANDIPACFTNNTYDVQSYFVSGNYTFVTEFIEVENRPECWRQCEEYDAAIYKIFTSLGVEYKRECMCMTNIDDCLVLWGDEVDPDSLFKGELYTKKKMGVCDHSYCEEKPDSDLCSAGNP